MILTIAFLAFNSSNANAQSVPCVDFENFSTTNYLTSPVVAPPGDSIPSDIHFYYDGYPIFSYDEYAFQSWASPARYTGTFLGDAGTLIITLDNPNNHGVLVFDHVNMNQTNIEVRLFDVNNVEITNGWTVYQPDDPPPYYTEEKYTTSIGGFAGNNIKEILVRNTTAKTGFVKVCIF